MKIDPTHEAHLAQTDPTSADANPMRDEFLRMLIAQLEHQDPLNPESGTEFVAQLAQFATLEQITASNDKLEALTQLETASQSASLAQLIGKDVSIPDNTVSINASGHGRIVATTEAPLMPGQQLVVLDNHGAVVSRTEAPDGATHFSWDYTDQNGNRVPAGQYRLVVRGTNAAGEVVDYASTISGTVTAVDYSNGAPTLLLGGVEITPGDVRVVTQEITNKGDNDVGF